MIYTRQSISSAVDSFYMRQIGAKKAIRKNNIASNDPELRGSDPHLLVPVDVIRKTRKLITNSAKQPNTLIVGQFNVEKMSDVLADMAKRGKLMGKPFNWTKYQESN